MIFNTTVSGASHRVSGTECQDFSLVWQNSSDSIRIAVVSDGHGGEVYRNSALGSSLACRIAVETLREVSSSIRQIFPSDERQIARAICRSILARWNDSVDKLRDEDDVISFGCTLIAYLQTANYWIAIQIGDGKFVTLDNTGKWSQPIPWDDKCILNFTTSMCDADALDEFRFSVGQTAPAAIFLATDGIDSTFEDGELLYNFLNHILESATHDGYLKICSDLPEVLTHFSEVGSGDDMSIAAIINQPRPDNTLSVNHRDFHAH
ncbi:MAG: protein phosphatase 2C domain-containing protein [Duncaniella sp.]|nr:protein phosphatase 2C domain-containing protein [Duncaniella sp.]